MHCKRTYSNSLESTDTPSKTYQKNRESPAFELAIAHVERLMVWSRSNQPGSIYISPCWIESADVVSMRSQTNSGGVPALLQITATGRTAPILRATYRHKDICSRRANLFKFAAIRSPHGWNRDGAFVTRFLLFVGHPRSSFGFYVLQNYQDSA